MQVHGLMRSTGYPTAVARHQAADPQQPFIPHRTCAGYSSWAGTRAAGDQRDVTDRRPDGLILLTLDGGHDVAQVRTTRTPQRGEQGALAEHAKVVGRIGSQQVVIEIDYSRPSAGDDAAAYDSERFARGGPVERGRHRCPPIHQEWFEIVVTQAQPPDVVRLAVAEVQPAEHQPFRLGVQRPQLLDRVANQRIALDKACGRTSGGPRVALPGEHVRPCAHRVDPLVDAIDDPLLAGDLLLSGLGHSPPVKRIEDGPTSVCAAQSREIVTRNDPFAVEPG